MPLDIHNHISFISLETLCRIHAADALLFLQEPQSNAAACNAGMQRPEESSSARIKLLICPA
jgi:hypothetical protein